MPELRYAAELSRTCNKAAPLRGAASGAPPRRALPRLCLGRPARRARAVLTAVVPLVRQAMHESEAKYICLSSRLIVPAAITCVGHVPHVAVRSASDDPP